GKIIWAKQNEIKLANIQQLEDHVFVDGEKIVLPVKELGSCEIFPQSLKHSPNGRFVVVCGDGEYIIYTALAWRNKSFGQALECVWANDSNQYAIRESTSKIKLYKSFKEVTNVSIRPSYAAEGIFGGSLLGVKSSSFVVFYDWETGTVVRRIDVACNNVYWSESDYVTITTNEGFYILKFNRATFQDLVETQAAGDEGYEEAFEFVTEVSENVVTGTWVGDCFVYTNANNRLNYLVGGQSSTISHFDSPVYIIGYAAKDSRVFLCDKHMSFMSYSLPVSLIEYQTAVLRGDSAAAQQLLPSIPKEHRNKLARFLEAQGLKSDALAISTDPEHRFELAMQLQELEIAYHIATELDHEHKWKSLGDFALSQWNFGLALESWKKANDLESVMLIYQTSGNEAGLKELAQTAESKGETNIAFSCYLLAGDVKSCLRLLINTNRIPEAAFFARTYCPSEVTGVVSKWKATLEQQGKKKAAEALADPKAYPNLFPDYEYGVQVEQILENKRLNGLPPAVSYLNQVVFDNIDLVSEVKNGQNLEELFGKVSLSPSRVASPIRPPSPAKQTKPEGKPIVNQHLRPKGIEMDEELISDNNSHLSLEVNTTGTGSIRGEVSDFADFEDTANGKVIDEIDDAELDAMLA
ncbi:hypothetical protein HDV04_004708, partial [Boothiomyces sp. JEL0838]